MSQVAGGVWSVLLGTVWVALGGLLATRGWNQIRVQEQWRGTVRGLVREVELNDRMIKAAADLVQRWPTRSETENFSYEPYHSTHITGLVTSSLLESPKDRALLEALEGYERAISRFNAVLRVVNRLNPGLFIRSDLIHTTDAKAWPPNSRDALAQPFLALLTAHEKVKDLLDREYTWAREPRS